MTWRTAVVAVLVLVYVVGAVYRAIGCVRGLRASVLTPEMLRSEIRLAVFDVVAWPIILVFTWAVT
jgi:hypothetical protein